MLSRRYIRIKVMQALYSYFLSNENNIAHQEKELFSSMDKIYDLYLFLLLLLIEIRAKARELIAIRKTKKLPTQEDITPNTKFIDNRIFGIISINKQLASETFIRKISWDKDRDIVQKIFSDISKSKEYAQYINSSERSFLEDKNFILDIWIQCIAENEHIHFFLEEKNIHWAGDIDFVNSIVVKTIDAIIENATDDHMIFNLFKDEEKDKLFAQELFRKVIAFSNEMDKIIQSKTQNWDIERIALMDILLMKMAIIEFLHFPTIPVKVTLNEYIELSKQYSTPKSSIFINGILDKLVLMFKDSGEFKKQGRGLIEN
ncbi:MAG: transcription antitermination factor NusB [Bacteroidota bacterium]